MLPFPRLSLTVVERAAFLAAVLSAGCASRPTSDEHDDALIGGAEVSVAELPSIVDIARVPRTGLPVTASPLPGSCTAARIGRRHLLLAAHCVLDPATVSPIWAKGAPIALMRNPTVGWTQAHVERTDIHPAWLAECDRTYCAASVVTAKLDAPDVAVLVLDQDIADVAIATVGDAPLAPGDDVIVTGFGCTNGVHEADTRQTLTLRAKTTDVAPVDDVVHPGSPIQREDTDVAAGNYNFTLGPGASAAMAGLCPGDSGGPLYQKQGSALVVVGVNSNYTLFDSLATDVGLPITNWHTRLDRASRHDVAGWLRGLHIDGR